MRVCLGHPVRSKPALFLQNIDVLKKSPPDNQRNRRNYHTHHSGLTLCRTIARLTLSCIRLHLGACHIYAQHYAQRAKTADAENKAGNEQTARTATLFFIFSAFLHIKFFIYQTLCHSSNMNIADVKINLLTNPKQNIQVKKCMQKQLFIIPEYQNNYCGRS